MRKMGKSIRLAAEGPIGMLIRLSTERFCFSGELGDHNCNLVVHRGGYDKIPHRRTQLAFPPAKR